MVAQSVEAQAEGLPTVSITSSEEVFLGGAPTTVERLEADLRALLREQPSDVVVLRADRSVPHGLTVEIMDAIKRSGAARVAIAAGG
jgi:biopolymer transport protein ExbD